MEWHAEAEFSPPQRLVDDDLWELVAPLIPEPPPAQGPRGRPRVSNRQVLDGASLLSHL